MSEPKADEDLANRIAQEIDQWRIEHPGAATVFTTLSALEIMRHVLTEGYLQASGQKPIDLG